MINDELLGVYSTDEVKTAYKWLDGKTIYKKCIYISAFPNTDENSYNLGFNVDILISLTGYAKTPSGAIFIVNGERPSYSITQGSTNGIGAWLADPSTIKISAGQDRSNCSGYIIIEYTKS